MLDLQRVEKHYLLLTQLFVPTCLASTWLVSTRLASTCPREQLAASIRPRQGRTHELFVPRKCSNISEYWFFLRHCDVIFLTYSASKSFAWSVIETRPCLYPHRWADIVPPIRRERPIIIIRRLPPRNGNKSYFFYVNLVH